jgi:hypothetical protein
MQGNRAMVVVGRGEAVGENATIELRLRWRQLETVGAMMDIGGCHWWQWTVTVGRQRQDEQ